MLVADWYLCVKQTAVPGVDREGRSPRAHREVRVPRGELVQRVLRAAQAVRHGQSGWPARRSGVRQQCNARECALGIRLSSCFLTYCRHARANFLQIRHRHAAWVASQVCTRLSLPLNSSALPVHLHSYSLSAAVREAHASDLYEYMYSVLLS